MMEILIACTSKQFLRTKEAHYKCLPACTPAPAYSVCSQSPCRSLQCLDLLREEVGLFPSELEDGEKFKLKRLCTHVLRDPSETLSVSLPHDNRAHEDLDRADILKRNLALFQQEENSRRSVSAL